MQGLDVFMAGDDVPEKKPDPSIYAIAAERLQLAPAECLVIEDSAMGLKVRRMSSNLNAVCMHVFRQHGGTPLLPCNTKFFMLRHY